MRHSMYWSVFGRWGRCILTLLAAAVPASEIDTGSFDRHSGSHVVHCEVPSGCGPALMETSTRVFSPRSTMDLGASPPT